MNNGSVLSCEKDSKLTHTLKVSKSIFECSCDVGVSISIERINSSLNFINLDITSWLFLVVEENLSESFVLFDINLDTGVSPQERSNFLFLKSVGGGINLDEAIFQVGSTNQLFLSGLVGYFVSLD